MAGRIMTRMTTDVDQFETLIENGLLAALVSFVTFVGVGRRAAADRTSSSALWTLTWSCPLAARDGVLPAPSPAGCTTWSRERIAVVNADFQE